MPDLAGMAPAAPDKLVVGDQAGADAGAESDDRERPASHPGAEPVVCDGRCLHVVGDRRGQPCLLRDQPPERHLVLPAQKMRADDGGVGSDAASLS